MDAHKLAKQANRLALDCLYQAMKLRSLGISNHPNRQRLIEMAVNYEKIAKYMLDLKQKSLRGES